MCVCVRQREREREGRRDGGRKREREDEEERGRGKRERARELRKTLKEEAIKWSGLRQLSSLLSFILSPQRTPSKFAETLSIYNIGIPTSLGLG